MSVIWAIHYRLLLTRIFIVSHPGVLMRLSRRWKCKAEQVCIWSGSKKQTKGKGGNRSDGVLFFLLSEFKEEKKILRWARDKARLLSCYGNSYTPISLFTEYCAVIFDEEREHTCARLQITHIHTQTHAVRTIKPTVQITALEKIAIILDESSVSARRIDSGILKTTWL